MKIAVCLSGQLRTGVKTATNIKSYLGKLLPDCDFFVHTWNKESIGRFDELSNPGAHNMPLFDVDKIKVSEFYSAYDPVTMSVDDYELRSKDGDYISMFHSIYLSNKFKKDYEDRYNFKYDYVIRMRPDIIFHESKSLEEDLLLVNNNTFFYADFHNRNLGEKNLEDIFWIATSDVMDYITNFYHIRGKSIARNHDIDWQEHMALWIRYSTGYRFNRLPNSRMRPYRQSEVNTNIGLIV